MASNDFDWRSACMDAERRAIVAQRTVWKMGMELKSSWRWKNKTLEEIIGIFREEAEEDVDAGRY